MQTNPNLYLDHRQPEWAQFERAGLIWYDPVERVVIVRDELTEVTVRLVGTIVGATARVSPLTHGGSAA